MGTTVLTPPKQKAPREAGPPPRRGNNGSRGSGGGGGSDRDGSRQSPQWTSPPDASHAAIWIGIVSISMLFLALTVAMAARAGGPQQWVHVQAPFLLYFNTLILMLSSVALELSKRQLRAGAVLAFRRWLYASTALGMTFIVGQLVVWRELASLEIYLATNPSSTFFYVLTAVHGLHFLGGILALLYIVFRSGQIIWVPKARATLNAAALYWHFMDALWICIFVLVTARL
jgi:cytochrome c oxidase subunit III